LIDNADVVEALVKTEEERWVYAGGQVANPSPDPAMQKLEAEALQAANECLGRQRAKAAREHLSKTIADTREVLASSRHARVMNARDKHIAHALTRTRREQKTGPVAPVRYGDEHELLTLSVAIVHALHMWVNGKDLSFDDSREISRRNSQALWTECKFDIQR
jgi:hypothetical protein